MSFEKIRTPVCRINWPNLYEAKAVKEGQKKKWSATLIFDIEEIKSDPEALARFRKIKALADKAQREAWPNDEDLPENFISPFKDGVDKEDQDGFGEGKIFINVGRNEITKKGNKNTPPAVFDQQVLPISDPTRIYAGCHVRVTINAYNWEYMGKCGVSFGFEAVQLVRDGEPFRGKHRPEKDFDALEMET